ncbi:hypothetical protein CDD80_1900 [Ophiocordyceps camponoti-rufipedis]|uniref:AB hydrolase-1 domain-containing protein n=1 Tax=Ophiocordyceps camponoti-rufipedis TaxID=2004952 RepID=A0A2C5XL79_9HYPO|nr:hypothetical protein CDD80_1900 [Ophiocordyceps camponoti-rufipedis]
MRSLFLYLAASSVFHATAYSADEKPNKYPGENISWTPCGNTTQGTPLECSNITVPADQFAPKNQTSDLKFKIPLIRLRSKNGTKNLLFNPGGPGGSGVGAIRENGDALFNATGGDHHILSFDPRGVKGSDPQAACSSLSRPDPETPFAVRNPKLYAWATSYTKSCADIMGEHGKFINTPQTAADMNSIIDAVGQSDMYFLGVSYGSVLGQTYASLFPKRSARIIIDSNIHLKEYYESNVDTSTFDYTHEVWEGFIRECFKAGSRCALTPRARSEKELLDKVTSFIDGLGPAPMSIYVNATTNGFLTAYEVWFEIQQALYRPDSWRSTAAILNDMMDGNGTEALLAWKKGADEEEDEEDKVDADDDTKNMTKPASTEESSRLVITANDRPSGPANWTQGLDSLVKVLTPSFNKSAPWYETWNHDYFILQQWPINKTHPFQVTKNVNTAFPMLILQNRFDPVTPLVAAQFASQTFNDSRLVVVDGYGHGVVTMENDCANNNLQSYLVNGTLPKNGTMCKTETPTLPMNGTDGAMLSIDDTGGKQKGSDDEGLPPL